MRGLGTHAIEAAVFILLALALTATPAAALDGIGPKGAEHLNDSATAGEMQFSVNAAGSNISAITTNFIIPRDERWRYCQHITLKDQDGNTFETSEDDKLDVKMEIDNEGKRHYFLYLFRDDSVRKFDWDGGDHAAQVGTAEFNLSERIDWENVPKEFCVARPPSDETLYLQGYEKNTETSVRGDEWIKTIEDPKWDGSDNTTEDRYNNADGLAGLAVDGLGNLYFFQWLPDNAIYALVKLAIGSTEPEILISSIVGDMFSDSLLISPLWDAALTALGYSDRGGDPQNPDDTSHLKAFERNKGTLQESFYAPTGDFRDRFASVGGVGAGYYGKLSSCIQMFQGTQNSREKGAKGSDLFDGAGYSTSYTISEKGKVNAEGTRMLLGEEGIQARSVTASPKTSWNAAVLYGTDTAWLLPRDIEDAPVTAALTSPDSCTDATLVDVSITNVNATDYEADQLIATWRCAGGGTNTLLMQAYSESDGTWTQEGDTHAVAQTPASTYNDEFYALRCNGDGCSLDLYGYTDGISPDHNVAWFADDDMTPLFVGAASKYNNADTTGAVVVRYTGTDQEAVGFTDTYWVEDGKSAGRRNGALTYYDIVDPPDAATYALIPLTSCGPHLAALVPEGEKDWSVPVYCMSGDSYVLHTELPFPSGDIYAASPDLISPDICGVKGGTPKSGDHANGTIWATIPSLGSYQPWFFGWGNEGSDCNLLHPIAATPIGGGGIEPSGTTFVEEGSDGYFFFRPADNCRLEAMIIDGEVTLTSDDSYTFMNVSEPHTLEAFFASDGAAPTPTTSPGPGPDPEPEPTTAPTATPAPTAGPTGAPTATPTPAPGGGPDVEISGDVEASEDIGGEPGITDGISGDIGNVAGEILRDVLGDDAVIDDVTVEEIGEVREYTIRCSSPGGEATLSITTEPAESGGYVSNWVLMVYNSDTDSWESAEGTVATGALAAQTLTAGIRDGGPYDMDGEENGTVQARAACVKVKAPQEGGDGDGGGCTTGVSAAALLLVLLPLWVMRRR